jgi:electron transport complex protein RnfB
MTIAYSLISLGGIAALFAVLLYVVARRFHVKEDPRVKEVENLLPGINCGACGFPGCPGMAEALVKAFRRRGHFTPELPPRRPQHHGGDQFLLRTGSRNHR